jgi:hypothetical protein
MNEIHSLKAGGKIRYRETGPFWFNDMVQNAKALTRGKVYTLQSKKVFSSWVLITLKETGEVEYALHWFDIL